MFEFTEAIRIEAPAWQVWQRLLELEQWWLPSNPDHIGIEVRSEGKPIEPGTEIVFRERVAGVESHAEGMITQLVHGEEATWEGIAVYKYLGVRFNIHEGVSWKVAHDGNTSRLSASVWARFPAGVAGRILEWYAKSFLDIVRKDRQHARRELDYLKHESEAARRSSSIEADRG